MKLNKTLSALAGDPKCLFVLNHSGGKDSQCMYLLLKDLFPKSQTVVIHAHLPEVEWDGTEDFIRKTVDHELFIVQAKKTFFEMVEHRGMFPSPTTRQCTSDLKRNPIQTQIRRLCNERGFDKVVNCMGLRAEESGARKKKKVWKVNKTQTNSKRTWYEWLPIHKLKEPTVFKTIEDHGQTPFWVYAAGMSRKSCCFCIMASEKDHCTAAKLLETYNPALLEKYDAVEESTGQVMVMPSKSKGRRTLKQIIASASDWKTLLP